MNGDLESAAKLSKAVHEIETLLHPSTVRADAAPPAQIATSQASGYKGLGFRSIVFIIAGVNFVAFLIGTAALGGDAVNGKAEGGRYFVADHGKLTEVSEAAFTYSRMHCYAVWITHSIAMICGLLTCGQKGTK